MALRSSAAAPDTESAEKALNSREAEEEEVPKVTGRIQVGGGSDVLGSSGCGDGGVG